MATSARARRPSRRPTALEKAVLTALEDMKAVNVRVLDVRGQTDIADLMVVASGNSDRHVRSIADRVVEQARASGRRPMGVEGERDGEWVLVDLQDVLVHVMLPRVREFYSLEQLWEPAAHSRSAAAAKSSPGAKPAAAKPAAAKPRRRRSVGASTAR